MPSGAKRAVIFAAKRCWKAGPYLIPDPTFLGDEVDGGAPTGRDSTAQGALALGSIADKVPKPQRGEIPCRREGRVATGISPLQGWDRFPNPYPGLDALGCRISPPSGLPGRQREQKPEGFIKAPSAVFSVPPYA